MTKIAFIGTGIMGAGMARNLLKAGYDLTVWNRTAVKAQPLVEAGATLATTPAEAATQAGIIITIVGDDQSSREVWLGSNGILAGEPKHGAIAVESTTISLGWVRELHQALTTAGLRFIDCPVTGGRGGAENGTLTLLVGAEEATLAEARPVLDAYSQQIIHFGPSGAGTAYKLVANLMGAVHIVALAEGILLAEKAGLNMERVVEGLASGAVAGPLVKAFAARMANDAHDDVHFSARWMHKDAAYALKMATDIGQAIPMSAVAAQIYQMALSQGLGEKNVSVVVEALRQG
jgi:3-hydroxyisobutyrate dehydrogenase